MIKGVQSFFSVKTHIKTIQCLYYKVQFIARPGSTWLMKKTEICSYRDAFKYSAAKVNRHEAEYDRIVLETLVEFIVIFASGLLGIYFSGISYNVSMFGFVIFFCGFFYVVQTYYCLTKVFFEREFD